MDFLYQRRSQPSTPPGSAPLGQQGQIQISTVVYMEFHKNRRGRRTPMSYGSSATVLICFFCCNRQMMILQYKFKLNIGVAARILVDYRNYNSHLRLFDRLIYDVVVVLFSMFNA